MTANDLTTRTESLGWTSRSAALAAFVAAGPLASVLLVAHESRHFAFGVGGPLLLTLLAWAPLPLSVPILLLQFRIDRVAGDTRGLRRFAALAADPVALVSLLLNLAGLLTAAAYAAPFLLR